MSDVQLLALASVCATCALWLMFRMEPGLWRFIRMKWNGWQRRRLRQWMRAGFVMRRSNAFRDGAIF